MFDEAALECLALAMRVRVSVLETLMGAGFPAAGALREADRICGLVPLLLLVDQGFSTEELADAVGVSGRTIQRDKLKIAAVLAAEVGEEDSDGDVADPDLRGRLIA